MLGVDGQHARHDHQIWCGVVFRGKTYFAHRVAWILINGEIPVIEGADYRGTVLRHTCDNPLCVKPAHLRLGTHLDNMRDKVERNRTTRAKTHCKRGHLRNEANLYKSRGSFWACRTCHREKQRLYNQQRRLQSF